MARMPDLHENESLLRTDIGFYMRMSPYYGRISYGRANGSDARFNIRKSPFMDEYRANGSKAETFTKE